MNNKKMEREANLFAMLLLMPKQLLIKEIKAMNLDLSSDEGLIMLAKKFDVPLTAMAVRIGLLKRNEI